MMHQEPPCYRAMLLIEWHADAILCHFIRH